MVESLKELNRLCQKPRYHEDGNWMVRHLLRDAALPITWLLLHTPITANQVTLFSLLVGLFGISLFASFSPTSFLIGTLLLQFWYLLDHVDGQIARYRKSSCLSGRFFDFTTHHIIHGTVFFSLGFYLFRKTGISFWVIWGFLTSLAMILFNLITDTKYKTFLEAVDNKGAFEFTRRQSEKAPVSGGRTVFSFFHKTLEMHVLMNLLTLAALFEVFAKEAFDFRLIGFLFYGVTVPLITTAKIYHLISHKKVDDEFRILFKER